jgi:protein pelota
MKILRKDLKHGKMSLRIEVEDDLYYLADIISENDIVVSKTKRRLEIDRDTHRADRIDKETLTLGIEVDSVEFDQNVDRLRVTGKIVQGPENVPKADIHTLNLKPGMRLTIQKENWPEADLIKVEDSVKAIKAKILLVSIEEGLCSLGFLRNYGVQNIGSIRRTIAGKDELKEKAGEMSQFFQEVISALEKDSEFADRIIIAGPAFTKENFYKLLKEKKPEIAKKSIVESVSMGGEKGLQEIVKRGIIQRVVKESKIQKEVVALTKFFEEISKESGLASYGFKEVENSMNLGAVETLLVSNSLLRKSKAKKDKAIDVLIENIKKMRGTILIVSNEHELGKQLEGMGGVGALLRYKV